MSIFGSEPGDEVFVFLEDFEDQKSAHEIQTLVNQMAKLLDGYDACVALHAVLNAAAFVISRCSDSTSAALACADQSHALIKDLIVTNAPASRGNDGEAIPKETRH